MINIRFTYEEVVGYVNEHGNGDKILSEESEYRNCSSKIKILCNCNHEYEMTFSKYKSGRRCRTCHNQKSRIQLEKVKKYLNDNLEGYSIVPDTYIKASEKSEFICDKGHHFKTQFTSIKHGHLCPTCFKENKELTPKIAKEEFAKYGFELIDGYKNQSSKATVKCENGHVLELSLSKIKCGTGCKYCINNNFKYTQEYVENYLSEHGYTLIDEYTGKDQKLNMLCPNGHNIIMSFSVFKNANCRCSKCKCSNGESEIIYYLDKNNINYIHQYRFDDCRDTNPLPFDFYIKNKNTCIEFDREQHYKPTKKFNGQEGFEERIFHDDIKNKYCENNNIKLIRIPYWDFNNIEQILKKEQII